MSSSPEEQHKASSAVKWRRFARSPWAGVVLVAVCFLAYFPGLFTMPPVDRDESRFAQATRQMVDGVREAETGQDVARALAVPMIQDRPRLNKPPLVYWLQAVSAGALGLDRADRDIGREWFGGSLPTGNIGAFRLVSAVCAALAVLFTWRMGLRLFDPRAALLGAVLLGTCVMVLWDARQARSDQLLLASTTLTMWALAACWRQYMSGPSTSPTILSAQTGTPSPQPSRQSTARGRGSRSKARVKVLSAYVFWACVGLGIMSKGPITPLVVVPGVIAAAAATGRWGFIKALRPVTGVLLAIGMALPWVAMVAWAQGGLGAYASVLWDEIFRRAAGGKEHFVPLVGYHVVLSAVLFFPGSLLTLAGFARAMRVARHGRSKGIRHEAFGSSSAPSLLARVKGVTVGWVGKCEPSSELLCVCLIVPAWVVFELTPAKLPHYTMPMYPLLALLSARAVLVTKVMKKADKVIYAGIGTAIYGLCVFILIDVGGLNMFGPLNTYNGLVSLASFILVISSPWLLALAWMSRRRSLVRLQINWVVCMIALSSILFGLLLPNMSRGWPSSRVLHALEWHGREVPSDFNAMGYAEDSLVFLTRGHLNKIDTEQACNWFKGDRTAGSVLVLDESLRRSLACATSEFAPTVGIGWPQGYNTANGKLVTLGVYSAPPGNEEILDSSWRYLAPWTRIRPEVGPSIRYDGLTND